MPYERAVACLRRRQRHAVRVVLIYTFVSCSVFQRVKRFESCLAAKIKKGSASEIRALTDPHRTDHTCILQDPGAVSVPIRWRPRIDTLGMDATLQESIPSVPIVSLAYNLFLTTNRVISNHTGTFPPLGIGAQSLLDSRIIFQASSLSSY